MPKKVYEAFNGCDFQDFDVKNVVYEIFIC